MKIKRHFLTGFDSHTVGQYSIERTGQTVAFNGALRPQRTAKIVRMNAGISATATRYAFTHAENFFNGVLQAFLDGYSVRLNLPSVKVRAVIHQAKRKVSHLTSTALK
jgi:hypothetical protein